LIAFGNAIAKLYGFAESFFETGVNVLHDKYSKIGGRAIVAPSPQFAGMA
jgi:hypothetical protein